MLSPEEPFAVASALTAGLSRGELRSATLTAPFHGVRAPAGKTDDLPARCRALATVLDDGVAFSHVTALRLLGVDVPWTLADDHRIHVTTGAAADRPQRAEIVAHRSRQKMLDTTQRHGLLITTPAQTFVQVACTLRRPDDVVVLGDAMLRRRSPLTTVTELSEVAARTRKVKGVAQVREQIPRIRRGTDSVMETRTRLLLVGAGLGQPLVNEVVTRDDGTYVKRVDLLYPQHRLAIEYDGDHHRTDKEQWRDDVRRRRWLEELGWTVIVVVADDIIRDPERLVARVRQAQHQAERTQHS